MGRSKVWATFLLIALAGATACADSDGFADELDIDLGSMEERPGGLYVEDVEVGNGAEAFVGQLVVVHYTGWLTDGSEFDSSRNAGVPLDVVIGQGNVIQGWDEGIPGMREGGRRRLVIPPGLAYGASGAGGVIPPNATLVFDVELLEVREPDLPPPDLMAPADTTLSADTVR